MKEGALSLRGSRERASQHSAVLPSSSGMAQQLQRGLEGPLQPEEWWPQHGGLRGKDSPLIGVLAWGLGKLHAVPCFASHLVSVPRFPICEMGIIGLLYLMGALGGAQILPHYDTGERYLGLTC